MTLRAVSRACFAWLASIRPDPSGDLKALTKRFARAIKTTDLAPVYDRLGGEDGHRSGRLLCRYGARLRRRHERLAEHEHVLVRDDLRAVAFCAASASVERLPERGAHHQFALMHPRKQADHALPVEKAGVFAERDCCLLYTSDAADE